MMTVVRGRYFPAAVRLPDMTRELRRVYVIVAQGGEHDGLWVWTRPDHLAAHRGVDWARTSIPANSRQARNGVDVYLDDGSVATITAGQGCKCGQLGRWAGPDWATAVAVGA